MRKNEKGFTLIELLVVVAIIGILAAIAIPQFAAYRVRSFNATAEADLRNGATAQEAAFVDNQAYASCATDACECADPTACTADELPGFKISKIPSEVGGADTVALDTYEHTARNDDVPPAFGVESSHTNGDKVYTWDSATSKLEFDAKS